MFNSIERLWSLVKGIFRKKILSKVEEVKSRDQLFQIVKEILDDLDVDMV